MKDPRLEIWRTLIESPHRMIAEPPPHRWHLSQLFRKTALPLGTM